MSTLTVGYMVNIVEKKLLDESNADYTKADLIGFYNLSLRLIVSLIPRAYTITSSIKLASGTQQSIPSDGLALVGVPRNMGTNGTTAGAAIREASLDAFNQMFPNWSTTTAAAVIKNFMRIPGMDASFFVYPPSDGTPYVQCVNSATPPTTTYDVEGLWEDDKIPLSDEFVGAIPDAMLFHAYDDDSDMPGNTTRSQIYYNRLLQNLGLKDAQTGRRK